MIKIEREYVSGSGTKYIRTLDASSKPGSVGDDEKVRWKCEDRRIRRGRYLTYEQWLDIERQVEDAYASEYDVDFTSIFDIYPKDSKDVEGVLFYETYFKGDEQFGHSSNIEHIGALGTYVPKPRAKRDNKDYVSTKTTSFKFYADKAKAAEKKEQKKDHSATSTAINIVTSAVAAVASAVKPQNSPSDGRPKSPGKQRVIQMDYSALGIKS